MKKRVITLVVVTAIWVLVMAVVFKTPPIWGWAILAALWWLVIENTKKPSEKDVATTKSEE